MYRNPASNRKISIMSPALALGQTVHEEVEALSVLPVEERFVVPLAEKFAKVWEKVRGERGGFKSGDEELAAKDRGLKMLSRITANPGPVGRKAVKIRQDLPYYWLDEEANIILCGKIDWLEYLPAINSVAVLDFKTGKYDEDPESLQLPIYLLLVSNCQDRPVASAAYWYLDRDDQPGQVELPDIDFAREKVTSIAKKIAVARKLNHFVCPKAGGCRNCRDLELAVAGKARMVGTNDFGQEQYVID